MSLSAASARAEYDTLGPTDPLATKVLQRAWDLLLESDLAHKLDVFDLFVFDPAQLSAEMAASRYVTDALQAFLDLNAILLNQTFLLEIEAAVRSFALSDSVLQSEYLESDDRLLSLVKRIEPEPARYLKHLRRISPRWPDGSGEQGLEDALILILLYFLSHELAHLAEGEDQGRFATFIDSNAPEDLRVANAAVKARRHVEEFAAIGFDLPGWEETLESMQIAEIDEVMRQELGNMDECHRTWYAAESRADELAQQTVFNYIERVSGADTRSADRLEFLFISGLYGFSLYAWYRDFGRLCERLKISTCGDGCELSLALARNRGAYIRAAAVLGEVHRFTLLRAFLAIEAMRKAKGGPRSTGELSQREYGQNSCCDLMIRALMDTPVKIAYVCATTGWLLLIDRKIYASKGYRLSDDELLLATPRQILLVRFDSICQARDRVINLIS